MDIANVDNYEICNNCICIPVCMNKSDRKLLKDCTTIRYYMIDACNAIGSKSILVVFTFYGLDGRNVTIQKDAGSKLFYTYPEREGDIND